MFSGEYLVTFDAVDAQNPEAKVSVKLLADEREVTLLQKKQTPERGKPVKGLLRVEVLEKAKGLALLVLPQPAQPVGERAYVEEDRVQEKVGA
jgi:hypothetical protein